MFYLLAVLFVVVCVLIGAAIVSFPFFLQWLARENIFFTTVKEGTAKAIMRGDSFERFIMSFSGYHINAPGKYGYKTEFVNSDGKTEKLPDWEVVYHGVGNEKGFEQTDDCAYDDRSELLKKLGLYWVGWPWATNVYVYMFEWNEASTNKEGEEKVLPRAEASDFIFVADFTYIVVTKDAETKDRLQTDETTLVTVAVRNPYRALFSGEDWMRRVVAAVNREMRTFVGSKSYQQLISSDEESGDRETAKEIWKNLSASIIDLSDRLPDDGKSKLLGLGGRYGVKIRTADLQTMDLSGEAKKQHQEAATKVYTTKQEAEALELTGGAQAKVIKMKGDKEAEALQARLKVIKKHGDAGMLLAQLDAMQESAKGAGNTIIWANSPFAPLIGMLKPETKGDTKS
ncbi:MAG: hypothetical protein WC887_01005 [Candidatus Paceibacterota bacterium]|jgi:regulator of protease activity HflC (stomatin/prohibitin superfamily)